MDISRKGTISISDDDEGYCDNGKLIVVLDSNRVHHLLQNALTIVPDFYNTKLFKELVSIDSNEENCGFCCDIEFRANVKKIVCPSCGNVVSLT